MPLFSCSPPLKLDLTSTRGRSDDCGSLHEDGLRYIPHIEGIPMIEPNVKKEKWGFHHHSTACLLCPRHLRDYFDNDRERFCHQIWEASLVITHNNWPTFLFPKEGYNHNHINKDILWSSFLLSVCMLPALGCLLIFSLVLLPPVHRATHYDEGNAWKIHQKKVHC